MAAPALKTLKDLNGKWALNKSLSDSPEPGLALQGISFITRKLIGRASISMVVTEYEAAPTPLASDEDATAAAAAPKVTHIEIKQTASGLSSTCEKRCVDNQPCPHSDWLFGNVEGRSSWLAGLDDGIDAYLAGGWDSAENDIFLLNRVKSLDKDWTADQVWGFQTINGERRHCRNALICKGDERAEFRLVYDYVG